MFFFLFQCALPAVIQQRVISAYNDIYATPTLNGTISFTLQIENLKQPYQYPVLQVCSTINCQNYITDQYAYTRGERYQFIKQTANNTAVQYQVISLANQSKIGNQIFTLTIESGASNQCSPLCGQHNNGDCIAGVCQCRNSDYIGPHCNIFLKEVQLQEQIEESLSQTGYLESVNIVIPANISTEVQRLDIYSETNLFVYIKFILADNLPGSQYGENQITPIKIQKRGLISFNFKNETPLIVTIEKISLYQQVTFTIVFRQKMSLAVWVIVLIVVCVGVGTIAIICIIYYICSKNSGNRHGVHPDQGHGLTTDQQQMLFNKYFPQIHYSELLSLSQSEGLHKIVTNDECIICIEQFKPQNLTRVLYCQHYFHSKCMRQWFKKNRNCPYCRFDHSLNKVPELASQLGIDYDTPKQTIIKRILQKQQGQDISEKQIT